MISTPYKVIQQPYYITILEEIKWLVINPNPCSKCAMSSYCCGRDNYHEWKEKLNKYLEKHM